MDPTIDHHAFHHSSLHLLILGALRYVLGTLFLKVLGFIDVILQDRGAKKPGTLSGAWLIGNA